MSETKTARNKLKTVREIADWIDKEIVDHQKQYIKGDNKFVDGAMAALGNLRHFIDTPDTNPADIPSNPVEGVFKCPSCNAPWDIIAHNACQCGATVRIEPVRAPSKEGASQSSKEIANEIEEIAFEVCPHEVYGESADDRQKSRLRTEYIEGAKNGAFAMHLKRQSHLSYITEELRIARKNVDGFTEWWSQAKAERDAAYEENRKLLLKTAQLRKVENETNTQEIIDTRKERDFALKELQTWKDECNTVRSPPRRKEPGECRAEGMDSH